MTEETSIGQLEHFFSCPYCGSQVSVVLDLSIPHQKYIEDCEICCQPIELEYSSERGNLNFFSARSELNT